VRERESARNREGILLPPTHRHITVHPHTHPHAHATPTHLVKLFSTAMTKSPVPPPPPRGPALRCLSPIKAPSPRPELLTPPLGSLPIPPLAPPSDSRSLFIRSATAAGRKSRCVCVVVVCVTVVCGVCASARSRETKRKNTRCVLACVCVRVCVWCVCVCSCVCTFVPASDKCTTHQPTYGRNRLPTPLQQSMYGRK